MKGIIKKSAAVLLSLMLLLALLPEGAAAVNTLTSGICGANVAWMLDSAGVLTISGTGEMEDYDYGDAPWSDLSDGIKTAVISEGVTSIGDYAVSGCSGLTSVTIPSSVTSIGESAFYDCSGLTSVTIPSSVTSIGDSAFYDCSSLTSVTIPSSVTSIGLLAFDLCIGLTDIYVASWNANYRSEDGVLFNKDKTELICYPAGKQGAYIVPSSVTSISDYAFDCCVGLTDIFVASGNANYRSEDGVLFNKDKTELIMYPGGKQGAYTIPSSVTSIESSAFSGCSGLTSLTIPSNVTNIGDGAFAYSTEYVSILTDITVASDNPYYSSEDGVLFNKDKTELIIYPGGKQGAYTIPPSVTSIGDHAFAWCDSLTSVTIPSGVTSIGNDAFYDCSGLTIVTIPLSVTSIGDFAFYGCSGLKVVFYGGSRDEWNALSLDYTNDSLSDALIRYNNIATIRKQPENFTGGIGDAVSFIVEATGDGLSYQWQYSSDGGRTWGNSGLPGNKTATLSTTLTEARLIYRFRCVVIDSSGNSVTSDAVRMIKQTPAAELAITLQPIDYTGRVGDAVSFSISAAGDRLSYQWQYSSDGGKTWGNSGLPGNKTATLSTTLTEARLIYRFRCVITDGGGNMLNSDIVRMIKAAPTLYITEQPTDFTGSIGDAVSFTVTASGSDLTYQWQYSSDGGKTWGSSGLPGNKTATLTTTLTEARLIYRFRCVVTDGSGNKLNSDIVRMMKANSDILD
jgi:hypothetical protein